MNPNSLFSLSDHLEKLSKDGDPLEVLGATVDFEYLDTRKNLLSKYLAGCGNTFDSGSFMI